ncbi:MAG: hypothetical protein WA434_08865 [Candidatus Acidiferrales bacterium]
MEKLTPNRIRKIRRSLGLSKRELARTLWAAEVSVDHWESGGRTPAGIHCRLLILLEQQVASPVLRAALRDSRAENPMFLIYRLLDLVYGDHGT